MLLKRIRYTMPNILHIAPAPLRINALRIMLFDFLFFIFLPLSDKIYAEKRKFIYLSSKSTAGKQEKVPGVSMLPAPFLLLFHLTADESSRYFRTFDFCFS